MRWIDQDRIELPEGWLGKAAAAKKRVELENLKPDDFSDIWRELKDQFSELSGRRCWICEAPATRSDNAIDHFRPKNRVAEGKKNNAGYRWLAFDYRNFRYICTFCNSRRIDVVGKTDGGKADHFPLRNETFRSYSEDDGIESEDPMLLDPCDPFDWKLLSCSEESGHPIASTNNEDEKMRVEISIEIYHLHQSALKKMRLTKIRDLESKIQNAKYFFEQVEINPEMRSRFKDALAQILRIISPGSDFSGEMYNHVKKRRDSNYSWLDKILR